MKREFIGKGIVFAATLCILAGCKKTTDNSAASRQPVGTIPPPIEQPATKSSSDDVQTPFQDESQYIVKTIVSDLAEDMFYAAHRRLPDSNQFSVKVEENTNAPVDTPIYKIEINLGTKFPVLRTDLKVDGPIWSPDVYRDFTGLLATTAGLSNSRSQGVESTELLEALTDGKASTIERQNKRLSAAMQRDFPNERLHEEAAMLLSAFALRDHSYNFFDISATLCRISTHLCMARYLSDQKPLGINGQIAEAALFTLMNNETAALEKIHAIEPPNRTVAVWLPVLEAYNTEDYRTIVKSGMTTPVERIAWFYAYCESVNVDLAWNKLSETEKIIPDFVRIAHSESFSVETGHQLLRLSLPLEIKELAAVYQLNQNKELPRDGLIQALNELPETGCIASGQVKIISWGQWADFFQKHICNAIAQNYRFISHQWGDPDTAKAFSDKTDQTFSELRLYSFVRALKKSTPSPLNKVDPERLRIVTTTPWLVPGRCWTRLYDSFSYSDRLMTNSKTGSVYHGFAPPDRIKEEAGWHRHIPLPGTAYDSLSLIDIPYFKNSSDFAALGEKLHNISPNNQRLSYRMFEYGYDPRPNYEEAKALYQPVLAFSSSAMVRVAETATNKPGDYEKLMSAAAELDPSGYYALGNYFEARNEDDKAAAYFEKENLYDPDSVRASYDAAWLAKYYLKRGETNKAERVVNAASDTYSEAGLHAKVNFLISVGKITEARVWAVKLKDRYGESVWVPDKAPAAPFTPVATFAPFAVNVHVTHVAHVTPIAPVAPVQSFPPRLEHVTLDDLKGPPTNGVLVFDPSKLVMDAGLKKGDVIVALNSKRLRTKDDFLFNTPTTDTQFFVWRNDRYIQIDFKAVNARRLYPAMFHDYPPPGP